VNQIGTKFGYLVNDHHEVSLAYAYLPTIWGAGSFTTDRNGFSEHEIGHIFGTFNAMPVHNQALGYTLNTGDWKFKNVLFRSAGQHTIDGGGDNPGHYQIEFVSLTSGVSKVF
jgi:hypothetical protein